MTRASIMFASTIVTACTCGFAQDAPERQLPDMSIKGLTEKITRSAKSERWHPASTAFVVALWKDFAAAHTEKKELLAGRSTSARAIPDVKTYDEYLGTYGPREMKVARNKDGRLFVHFGPIVMPAVAAGKMILFTTGDMVTSPMPQIGDKPYAALELYCLARIDGQYHVFFPHEGPTEKNKLTLLRNQE